MVNSLNKETYRYGFQGQEKDDEIKGSGNSINYKYRVHDPRLGRFLSIDPLAAKFSHNSPYAFSENSTIAFVELEGLEKVQFGYKGKTVDISKMTAEEVVELAQSSGFNWDPNWINKNAQKEFWYLSNSRNPDGNSMGSTLRKYCSKSECNEYGGGQYYFEGSERSFGQWAAAKDNELRDWKEGTYLMVNTWFTILPVGKGYQGVYALTKAAVDFAITADNFSSVNKEFTILENTLNNYFGEDAVEFLRDAKIIKQVTNIGKNTKQFTIGLSDGNSYEMIYNVANKTWNIFNLTNQSNEEKEQ